MQFRLASLLHLILILALLVQWALLVIVADRFDVALCVMFLVGLPYLAILWYRREIRGFKGALFTGYLGILWLLVTVWTTAIVSLIAGNPDVNGEFAIVNRQFCALVISTFRE